MADTCAQARYRLAKRVEALKGPSPLPTRIAGGIKQGWLAAVTPAEKHTLSLISNVPRGIVEANSDAVADWLSHQGNVQERTIAAPGVQGLVNAMRGFGKGAADTKSDFSGFFGKRELGGAGESGGEYAAGGVRYKTPLARWMVSRIQAWSAARNRPFFQAAYEYNLTAKARAMAIREKAAGSPESLTALTTKWHDNPTPNMVIDAHAAAERFTFGQENTLSKMVQGAKGKLKGESANPPRLRSAREAAEAQATSEGLSGPGAANRVAKLMSLPTKDFNAQVTVPRARTTGELTSAGQASGMAKLASGATDIVAGFPKIMGNLATATVDYTPLGLAKTIYRTVQATPGNKGGALLAGLGRNATLGGGAMGLGYYLASQGKMTGPIAQKGPEGVSSYHVRIGDGWYNYGLLEPLAAGMAAGAALFEDTKTNPGNYLSHIGMATKEGATQAIKAVGQAVGPVANLASGRLADAKKGAEDFLTAPVPTLVRQAAKGLAGDRQTTGVSDQVKAAIPGLANTLPKKLDALGQQQHEGSAAEAMRDMLIAGGTTPDRTSDPVVREFQRLGLNMTVPKPTRSFRTPEGKTTVTLSPEEENQMLVGRAQAFEDLFTSILENPEYQAASDSTKKVFLRSEKKRADDYLDRPAFASKYYGVAP